MSTLQLYTTGTTVSLDNLVYELISKLHKYVPKVKQSELLLEFAFVAVRATQNFHRKPHWRERKDV